MRIAKALQEVRCELGKLHFMLNSQGLIEVKCRTCAGQISKEVGGRYVVFHYFDPKTGELVATRSYRDARELFTIVEQEGSDTLNLKGGET